MNLAQEVNLNTQRNSSNIREDGFVLVPRPPPIIPFVLRGAINLQFTVRRCIVETLVADGNLGLHGAFLQWVLAK